MSEHTEGPWKLEYRNNRFTGDVLAPNGSEVCTTWNHSQYGMFNKEANARLIAAAPTMAAYLERKAAEGDTEAQAILDTIA